MQSYHVPERQQEIFDTPTTIHSSITMALTAVYIPMSKFLGEMPRFPCLSIFSTTY